MRQIANGHTLWHTAFSKRWGAAYLSLLERAEDQERAQEDCRRRAFGEGIRGTYAVEHHDRTLTVDNSYPGRALGDGWTAFGSIQEALDSELSGLPGPRERLQRIVIMPGTYMEHLTVEKVVGLIGGGADSSAVRLLGDTQLRSGTSTPLKWKVQTELYTVA